MRVCLEESDAKFLHTFGVNPWQGSGEGWPKGSGSSDPVSPSATYPSGGVRVRGGGGRRRREEEEQEPEQQQQQEEEDGEWEHFPGQVQVHIGTRYESAWTWKHYEAAPDQFDKLNRCYPNKADRVVEEMWDFYTCGSGHEEDAKVVAHNRCRKLMKDMHYEAQVQCVINYISHVIGQCIKKEVARTVKLTREQYLQVPAWWCRNDVQCWECIVDKWFTPEWEEMHNTGREWRAHMPGPRHHQGSLSNEEYKARWGKASQAIYDPNDPPSSYINSSFYSRISAYKEVGKQVHGPEWDPAAHPLDGEAQLVEERRLRQESEVRQRADMANLLAYLQTMHAQMGGSLPPPPTISCPTPTTPQNQSAASNTLDMSTEMSLENEIQEGRDINVAVPAPGEIGTTIEPIRRNIFSDEENYIAAQRRKYFKEVVTWMTVLSSIVASVTYQAALNPPGGFWQEDDSQGHQAGDPVLRDEHWLRYQAFYWFNAMAFITSLMILAVTLNKQFYDTEANVLTLMLVVMVDVGSLIGAYVAGSTGNLLSSICVIVIALVALIILIFMARGRLKC
ncbi:hypothetical protein PR202_gb24629 [Eleusine coracana subsp. coracana]|uniref:PGG domain-containing protein n=1 Tax=Eleusine coracana subsp. coracana TaxID=191504 RepID=A0AAV5FLK0_ELECO|nr:hypothetical protein PR202_gb24629 [Eleusine coracana subsp. coracana]